MSHNHPGPPSNSGWHAGCRDARCVRAHDTYERLKPAPQIRAAEVTSTPLPIQPQEPAPVVLPVLERAAWTPPPMVELSVVEPEHYEPRPYRGLAAIRTLRTTAGV